MLTRGGAPLQAALQDHLSRQFALPAGSGRAPVPRRAADADEKGPRLTLAQRYGLAPAPGPKLSQKEWTVVHAKSLSRNDLKHGCPICCEEFKDEEQVLLSCSHVFHRKCLRSFEKFSKQRVCPICRQEEYQKKCILDARERYLERSAVAIQAAFRGYRMRKWYNRVKESDAPKDPVSRREYYAEQLGEANKKILKEMTDSRRDIEALFADIDNSLRLSKSLNQATDRRVAELGRGGAGGAAGAASPSVCAGFDWAHVKEISRRRGDKDCPICIAPLVRAGRRKRLAWLSCSHAFHLDCIRAFEGFQDSQGLKRTCPVCRVEEYSRLPSAKASRR